jgi:hypothetical protein
MCDVFVLDQMSERMTRVAFPSASVFAAACCCLVTWDG